LLVWCPYGYEAHTDSCSHPYASRVTNPGGHTGPVRLASPRGISTNGDQLTTATPNEPFAGYDKLKDKEVVASLSSHSQVELAKVDSYERAHEDRRVVFDKLRWLRQEEPLPGYDALSVDEVAAALERADVSTIKRVRGYERKFRARRSVLDEVTRLHRERRLPLASRDANR